MLPRPPKRAKAVAIPTPQTLHLQPDITITETDQDEPAKKNRRLLVSPHHHFKRFWAWWTGLGRNTRFGIIAALLLLFGAGSIGWYHFIQPDSAPSILIHKNPPPPKPATVASPLTGLQVAPVLAARPVTGIMIENSTDARPQSGLQDAGVVYEAIAEGGVTRFLALFQDSQPQYIGPVRSLRPYFIDFAAPFQASIAHVGGSPDALSEVRSGPYRDIDQFFNSGAYWRSGSRPAPHNVYTSFARLDGLNQSKGYTSSSFTSWPRKADKKLAVPTAKSVNLTMSGPIYNVHYDYDATSNSYLRSEGGAAHMDFVSSDDKAGVQLKPKVVIALAMPYSYGALDASGAYYSQYADTGSGTAYIFQDGGVIPAVWSKAGTSDQISFKDSAGAPIKLNSGQTWLTLVKTTGDVSYSP